MVVLGVLRASFAFPQVIPGKEWLISAAECAFLVSLFIRFRRQAASDPVERIRGALGSILPFEIAERASASELSVLYYAFAWGVCPHVPAGARAFTLHKRSGLGDTLLCMGLASLFELVPVHLLLRKWSAVAAWVLTGISVYGVIWLVALVRSLGLRPAYVEAEAATIRFGLLFSLRIPARSIASVSSEIAPAALVIPRRATPSVCVELTEPLLAERIFGMHRMVNSIAVAADEPAMLLASLSRMTQNERGPEEARIPAGTLGLRSEEFPARRLKRSSCPTAGNEPE